MKESAASSIERRARTALAGSPIYDLRSLQVERSGDALFISGRVKTFYHKQLAQELVRHVADGVALINAVDVS